MPAGAALYGTILAAYKTLAASYQTGYVNAVIVLTAGVDPRETSPAPSWCTNSASLTTGASGSRSS